MDSTSALARLWASSTTRQQIFAACALAVLAATLVFPPWCMDEPATGITWKLGRSWIGRPPEPPPYLLDIDDLARSERHTDEAWPQPPPDGPYIDPWNQTMDVFFLLLFSVAGFIGLRQVIVIRPRLYWSYIAFLVLGAIAWIVASNGAVVGPGMLLCLGAFFPLLAQPGVPPPHGRTTTFAPDPGRWDARSKDDPPRAEDRDRESS